MCVSFVSFLLFLAIAGIGNNLRARFHKRHGVLCGKNKHPIFLAEAKEQSKEVITPTKILNRGSVSYKNSLKKEQIYSE